MAQAVSCAAIAVAISLHLQLAEDDVEQFAAWSERAIRGAGHGPSRRSLFHCFQSCAAGASARAAARMAAPLLTCSCTNRDAMSSVHPDFQNRLLGGDILDDFDVTEFKPSGLVRPQSRIGHEQHIVVHLLARPPVPVVQWLLRPSARRLVECLVFVRREPSSMADFAGCLVGCGKIGSHGSNPW